MRAFAQTENFGRLPERSPIPGVALMGSVVLIALVLVALNSGLTETFPYLYILPWLLALSAVFAAPIVFLFYRGRLVIYDPIVFAVGSYLFPAFVIGGVMLLTGSSQPGILDLIQEPTFNLPYTIVLIMLGFAGLALGYLMPFGAVIGRTVEKFLPRSDFVPEHFIVPGLVLLLLGVASIILALVMGVIGYQLPEQITAFDGLVFMTTSFWTQAFFLLMYSLFRRKKYDFLFVLITMPLVAIALAKALFSGNRGSLIQIVVVFGLSYLFAGTKLSFRRMVLGVVVLCFALVLGMIYGTTFRNVKGNESQMSMDRYAENISSTFQNVHGSDISSTMSFAFSSIAVRLDALSTLAVVVSNYEQLAPYEESYSLDNNIWRDLSTFLIPRFLWKDKPSESDPRRYSDLYFNNSESSFVITPFGDLLRNFGPIGVPIGMFFFGIVLRSVYRALVEDQKLITWRVVLYFIILTAVSYEAFYSTLIPNMTKFGFTAVVGMVIVHFTARFLGYSQVETFRA